MGALLFIQWAHSGEIILDRMRGEKNFQRSIAALGLDLSAADTIFFDFTFTSSDEISQIKEYYLRYSRRFDTGISIFSGFKRRNEKWGFKVTGLEFGIQGTQRLVFKNLETLWSLSAGRFHHREEFEERNSPSPSINKTDFVQRFLALGIEQEVFNRIMVAGRYRYYHYLDNSLRLSFDPQGRRMAPFAIDGRYGMENWSGELSARIFLRRRMEVGIAYVQTEYVDAGQSRYGSIVVSDEIYGPLEGEIYYEHSLAANDGNVAGLGFSFIF